MAAIRPAGTGQEADMNYSELFIRRAAMAAHVRRGAEDWASLPIGERVTLIYREMRRLDAGSSGILVNAGADARRPGTRMPRQRHNGVGGVVPPPPAEQSARSW
jgi:hypothetical protein